LPVGATYYVVTQPVLAATYEARATQGFALSQSSPTAAVDVTTAAAGANGAVSGSVSPVVDANTQSDVATLLTSLDAGGQARSLIIRSAPTMTSQNAESYGFTTVPTGTYQVKVTRTTVDSQGGVSSVGTASSASVVVLPGATATANLTFP
jgi:hypothetical protein